MRQRVSVLQLFLWLLAAAAVGTLLLWRPADAALREQQVGRAQAVPGFLYGFLAQATQTGGRRETGPINPGPPPRTGPPSPFKPLIIPNFGPNYRANTDPQSPNLAQQEPSIAVNPLDPLDIVVMAKDERAGANTKQDWIYTSTDGGVTWINQQFPLRSPPAPYSSDPVVTFTDDGICYVTSLPYIPTGARASFPKGASTTVGVQVARSQDGGITFEPATQVINNLYADKEYTWIDNFPSSPYYHRIYVAWMDLELSGVFRVSYSTDRGDSWVQSSVAQGAYQFPMPVVLPNGDVLVTYSAPSDVSNVYVRSTDGGATFGSQQFISPITPPNCPPDNSGCTIWRLSAVPTNSVNPNDGTQVLVWSDGAEGSATVLYTRSTDAGVSWSAPALLAPPGVANTYQVEPWVTSDEQGTFHAIWYDDRDDPNTSIFNIYYSQSTDNGATWSVAQRISTASSDLRIGIPSSYARAAGDYINVSAAHGNVYGAWTDTREGTGEDIYVVRGYFGGTPTSTPTGTPPTPTSTHTRIPSATPTFTPTPTATVCGGGQYIVVQATGTIVPGTLDIGNHCDNCTTSVTLPFTYRLYDRTFTNVNVSSNGDLQFSGNAPDAGNSCLPAPAMEYAIMPHWADLRTDVTGDYGIFTSVSGTAPNRIFNIEWRTLLNNRRGDANFEVRLYENDTRFDLIYGAIAQYGTGATVGVQDSTGINYVQFECDTGGLGPGLLLHFYLPHCGSPTPTFTGTPPTATSTPTASPTVCVGNYLYATATATIVPGTTDVGNHCDDCTTNIQLPFPVQFYDQLFHMADVSSNGNLQFAGSDPASFNTCLSDSTLQAAIVPYWDDLLTDNEAGCPAGGCGIFTSTTGTAPNRVYNIEWRAVRYHDPTIPVHFEIRLYENQTQIDLVYAQVSEGGSAVTVGMQDDATRYTQFSCRTASLADGLLIRWSLQGCALPTATATATSTATSTATATATFTFTAVASATRTGSPTASPTACTMSFTDVSPTDWYYSYVLYLYCHGVISGYNTDPPCTTGVPCFNPGGTTTRGQLSKIVVLGFDMAINTTGGPHFSDVLPGSTFYRYIETLFNLGAISGYADGTFRPNNHVTRGQLTKIVVNSAVLVGVPGWHLQNPPNNTFEDVLPGSAFYRYIETAYANGVIGGYPCGTPPAGACTPPGNKPYFLPFNISTRAQISKITYLAITYTPPSGRGSSNGVVGRPPQTEGSDAVEIRNVFKPILCRKTLAEDGLQDLVGFISLQTSPLST